jgi:hypothetical protein
MPVDTLRKPTALTRGSAAVGLLEQPDIVAGPCLMPHGRKNKGTEFCDGVCTNQSSVHNPDPHICSACGESF